MGSRNYSKTIAYDWITNHNYHKSNIIDTRPKYKTEIGEKTHY